MKKAKVKNDNKYKRLSSYELDYNIDKLANEVEQVGLYDNCIINLDDNISKDIKEALEWRDEE